MSSFIQVTQDIMVSWTCSSYEPGKKFIQNIFGRQFEMWSSGTPEGSRSPALQKWVLSVEGGRNWLKIKFSTGLGWQWCPASGFY